MRSKKVLFIVYVLACILTLMTGCVGKEKAEKFPDKPISLIVNFGSGGPTDLSARALAKAIEEDLGVPVTVINKPGGSGSTGVIELKNSKNDGYTIGLLTYAPMVIIPHQTKVPYTPDDFEYILAYGEYRYGIVVKKDSPYKSIEDLIKAAKARKDGLSYSATGYPQPLVMNKLGDKGNCVFRYVPYKSGAEAMTAVLGGHVDSSIAIVSDFIPFLKTGELRLLASASSNRIDQAADVPTLKELGYDAEIKSLMGIGVPAGVPKERLEILRKAFKKAVENPKYLETMKNLSLPNIYISGDEYHKLVVDGYKEIGAVLKKMGIEPK